MHVNVDFVGENNVDVGVGVSNDVISIVVILLVHDFIIVGDFGASGVFERPFNILIGITFSSYNVHVISIDKWKTIIQVPLVGSMHQQKNVVQVLEFGIGRFRFEMDLEGAF
jgi:hypothetical protein